MPGPTALPDGGSNPHRQIAGAQVRRVSIAVLRPAAVYGSWVQFACYVARGGDPKNAVTPQAYRNTARYMGSLAARIPSDHSFCAPIRIVQYQRGCARRDAHRRKIRRRFAERGAGAAAVACRRARSGRGGAGSTVWFATGYDGIGRSIEDDIKAKFESDLTDDCKKVWKTRLRPEQITVLDLSSATNATTFASLLLAFPARRTDQTA